MHSVHTTCLRNHFDRNYIRYDVECVLVCVCVCAMFPGNLHFYAKTILGYNKLQDKYLQYYKSELSSGGYIFV